MYCYSRSAVANLTERKMQKYRWKEIHCHLKRIEHSSDSRLSDVTYTSDTRARTWSWGSVVVTVAHQQRPQRTPTFDHLLASTVGMVSLPLVRRDTTRAEAAVLQTCPSGARRSEIKSLQPAVKTEVSSAQTPVSPIFWAHDHTLRYRYQVSILTMTISTTVAEVWIVQIKFSFRAWLSVKSRHENVTQPRTTDWLLDS